MVARSLQSIDITITNPLVLYRSLVATGRFEPDPAQLRLALHLQKLYDRLKDYEPTVQYGHRLQQISRALSSTPSQRQDAQISSQAGTTKTSLLTRLLGRRGTSESLEVTKVLTSHEAALQLDSPKGLMLHGEVGTGKSMLIDLFADCLPTRRKRRYHFTTFMLEVISKLEKLRRSRQMVIPTSLGQQNDYSLLWLARELISTSPILFLDEFQLPDRAASKIMSNLMTSFFHLGGVLIATSNRMPEELAKAAGMEFTPPPSRLDSLSWRLGLSGTTKSRSDGLFAGHNEFVGFLEVLRARCDIWEMEGKKDYRRRDAEPLLATEPSTLSKATPITTDSTANIGHGQGDGEAKALEASLSFPRYYCVQPGGQTEGKSDWFTKIQEALAQSPTMDSGARRNPEAWTSGSVRVFGRDVIVPKQCNGVTHWTFSDLCASTLGPADYITLASTYHTLILEDVPILTFLQKNEARRLINLLDALYEARCKLLVSAKAGPDDIFFPELAVAENAAASSDDSSRKQVTDEDAIHSETFSEAYQDATSPFRPNISAYDSNFGGPDYSHARLQGLFNDDELEDGPPNIIRRAQAGREVPEPAVTRGPDFSRTSVFTGEDERFAYQRAKSRLWEMCGQRWWSRVEDGWWQPSAASTRHWEQSISTLTPPQSAVPGVNASSDGQVKEGAGATRDIDAQQDEVLFRHGASPFRTHHLAPPTFSWTHAWGMIRWGKKAGNWGQGVEGLKDRDKAKPK